MKQKSASCFGKPLISKTVENPLLGSKKPDAEISYESKDSEVNSRESEGQKSKRRMRKERKQKSERQKSVEIEAAPEASLPINPEPHPAQIWKEKMILDRQFLSGVKAQRSESFGRVIQTNENSPMRVLVPPIKLGFLQSTEKKTPYLRASSDIDKAQIVIAPISSFGMDA